MGKLDNKVALVTGGSDGIGFSIAKHFVSEGAFVYITGRRKTPLEEAEQKIGTNIKAIQADSSKLPDIEKVYNIIKKEKGYLNILVANAGVCSIDTLETVTEQNFDYIYDINVKGTLFTVQKMLPVLQAGGSIILIGSIASYKGYESMSVYCSSKAAVRSFARCWTIDLKKNNIRVNVLSPGEIRTNMEMYLMKTDEERKLFVDQVVAATPMGRRGDPDEVAKAAVFLASDESSFITGIELCVDGGIAQI